MIASNIGPLKSKPPRLPATSVRRQPLHIATRAHDSGVTAAADNEESAVSDADSQGLVVEVEGIGFPAVAESLVALEAGLELRRPVHLAGDQHALWVEPACGCRPVRGSDITMMRRARGKKRR
jgi:hypothetical protein